MQTYISFLVVLFLSLISQFTFSQSDKVQMLLDSSYQVIQTKPKADSLATIALELATRKQEYKGQLAALKALGWIAEYHYLDDSALDFYQKALSLAEKNDNRRDICKLYLEMAVIEESLGRRDTAITMTNQGLKLATEIGDTSGVVDAYYYLGYFYNNEGIHEKAIENYLSSLEIAEKIQDGAKIADVSQGIGIIYNKQKDYEKAEPYFNRSYDMFVQLKDTARYIGVMNDFGILNKNRGNYLESEKWYLKMYDLSEIEKFAWVKPYVYNNLGNLYFHMKLYEKGVEYSQKGVDHYMSAGNKRSESSGLTSLAKNQLALGQNKLAIQNLKRSLMLSREVQVMEKEREALLFLSNAYEKENQPQRALEYYKDYKIIYDSIYNSNKIEQIHGLEKKYQSEKKDREIALLEKNTELQSVKNNRLWIALGLTLFFGSLLIWMQIQKGKKEKQVQQEKQKVVRLENQRLTQELDFKKQELTSKVLQLCRKKEFLQSLNRQIQEIGAGMSSNEKNEIDRLSRQINLDIEADDDWEQFLKSFESVHPEFNAKITKQHPDFSKGELRMACLLKMNLSTKDIANLLNITIAGVKKTRNRMRKKMTIDSSVNLNSYFMALGV